MADVDHFPSVCRLLELMIWNNEVSKELCMGLKINQEEETLMDRLFQLFIKSMGSLEYPKDLLFASVCRLFMLWLSHYEEACVRLFELLNSYMPMILDYVTKDSGYSQSFCCCVLGSICLYSSNSVLSGMIMNNLGYTKYCMILEFVLNKKDFVSKERKRSFFVGESFLSTALVTEYRGYV